MLIAFKHTDLHMQSTQVQYISQINKKTSADVLTFGPSWQHTW